MEELVTRMVRLQITQHTVLCIVRGWPDSALEAHSSHLIHALWGRHALSPGPVWPRHDGGGDTQEALSYSWLLVREETSMLLGPLGEHFLPLDLGGRVSENGGLSLDCVSARWMLAGSLLSPPVWALPHVLSFPPCTCYDRNSVVLPVLFSMVGPCFRSSLPYNKYPQAKCYGTIAMLCSPPLWSGAPWPSGCVLSGLLRGWRSLWLGHLRFPTPTSGG